MSLKSKYSLLLVCTRLVV